MQATIQTLLGDFWVGSAYVLYLSREKQGCYAFFCFWSNHAMSAAKV